MDRSVSSKPDHSTAMRFTGSAAFELLLSATTGEHTKSASAPPARSVVFETPVFGSRKMAVELKVNRKRIQRLMRILGIEAHYRKPNLSRPAPGHEVYPYLLRGVEILRPTHVWSTDITYIPDAGRLSLRGGGYGLVQPVRPQLGTLQYVGNRLLPDCTSRRVPLRPTRNLELRSGLAVHFVGVPGSA